MNVFTYDKQHKQFLNKLKLLKKKHFVDNELAKGYGGIPTTSESKSMLLWERDSVLRRSRAVSLLRPI